ncbi:hypothetical protein ACJX0J_037596, partial [Zea mays]
MQTRILAFIVKQESMNLCAIIFSLYELQIEDRKQNYLFFIITKILNLLNLKINKRVKQNGNINKFLYTRYYFNFVWLYFLSLGRTSNRNGERDRKSDNYMGIWNDLIILQKINFAQAQGAK